MLIGLVYTLHQYLRVILMNLEKELKSSIDEKKVELSFKLKQISLIQRLNLSAQITIDFQLILTPLWPT